MAEARCGRADAAARRLRSLSVSGEAGSLVFAYELARQLPGFDAAAWTAQLQSAGRRWGGRDTESGWNAAISGILELDLGHTDESRALIESALLLPDRKPGSPSRPRSTPQLRREAMSKRTAALRAAWCVPAAATKSRSLC